MDKATEKKNWRTRLSVKALLYVLASAGYVLVVIGTAICLYFGSYNGKSRAYITNQFYDNAIEKYSMALVTQDIDFDYDTNDYKYTLFNGAGAEAIKKDILNGTTDSSLIRKTNMDNSDLETVKRSLEGYSVDGKVSINEYTYGANSYYRLTVDEDRLEWPYALGLDYITQGENDGPDYLGKIGVYPDKEGAYIYTQVGRKWYEAPEKICDCEFVFRKILNNKLRTVHYSCNDYSLIEAKNKAESEFKKYDADNKEDYEWYIDISPATDSYGNPYVGEPIKSIDGDKVRELNDKTVISGRLMSIDDSGNLAVSDNENPSDHYVVISYVPSKLSDPSSLFSRISSAVTGVMELAALGIVLVIAGIVAFLAGVVMFIVAAGHTERPDFPDRTDHYRRISDNDYIERKAFSNIPLDLATVIYIILAVVILETSTMIRIDLTGAIIFVAVIYLLFVVSSIYLTSLAVNIKSGCAGKRTIIYRLYNSLSDRIKRSRLAEEKRRTVKDFYRRGKIIYWSDVVINVVIGFMVLYGALYRSVIFILIALIVFVAKEVKKHRRLNDFAGGFAVIKKAAAEIAAGNMNYEVGSAGLPVDEKQIVDDLNSISNSIDKAVDERMKSEHMQTELITNVSHDIRTPLTSIINYTDLLSKTDTTDEQKNEYLAVLKKQSNKLKKLINDLIDASKAESGKIDMHPEDINAGTMLSMMAGEYEEKLSKKNVTLEVTGLEDDTTIKADPNYLGRVFQNLFGNMVKYTQPGTRAYVDIESSDNKVTVIFRNISLERLHITADELTERFVRGDRSRTTEGSGLGLSIAKNLTELMGGQFLLTIDGDLFKVELKF